MAGSDLDTELRRRAEEKADAILGAAREDARRIASEADRLIDERRREVMRDREAEYGSEARRAIAVERHAAMRAVLLARTRVVARVLERTRTMLFEATQTDTYVLGLGDELDQALDFVEDEGALVRCSEHLESAVREVLRSRPKLTVEPEVDLGNGFIVVGGGGAVLVDGRLESRIERLAPVLAIEIHARLEER